MKRILLTIFFVFFVFDVYAQQLNTLIAVNAVSLDNKGNPIVKEYRFNRLTYRLINEDTNKTVTIRQYGRAKSLYLEPGSYCFNAWMFSTSQPVNVVNPLCFIVPQNGVVNAGTWVMGVRASNSQWYSKLLDMKENYKEVEALLDMPNSIPAKFKAPNL
ncbi:hypothetical protein ACE02D_01085 [Shewanella bicestrii]|nr:Uncharacterised protein [Shewanella putrefaciens]